MTAPILAFVIGKNKNEQINEIRFYHIYWTIEEQHHVRLNILPLEVQAPKIPPDVLAYHAALRDGNIENVLGLFSKGGSIREPSGGISGPGQESKLQDFFFRTFKKRGVSLIYHTVVDDEKGCAAEYSCTKWGTTEIIPQAGMEFFDREESRLSRTHQRCLKVRTPCRLNGGISLKSDRNTRTVSILLLNIKISYVSWV
jgi:hypothetical protein